RTHARAVVAELGRLAGDRGAHASWAGGSVGRFGTGPLTIADARQARAGALQFDVFVDLPRARMPHALFADRASLVRAAMRFRAVATGRADVDAIARRGVAPHVGPARHPGAQRHAAAGRRVALLGRRTTDARAERHAHARCRIALLPGARNADANADAPTGRRVALLAGRTSHAHAERHARSRRGRAL